MKVLVTGAAGFAGRHLVQELLRQGPVELVAASLDGLPAPGLEATGVRWICLDTTSSESLADAIRGFEPDQVYHLAGQSSVGRSFEAPLETWEINATGTLRLLDALERESRTRARVLIISSAEVYGAVSEADQPIDESLPLRPITPYGVSKAAAELVALQMGAVGSVEVVVARSFNHIGPGQDVRFALPSIARQLVRIQRGEAEPELRVGNLEARRDFLDVRDVVGAYVWLMRAGVAGEVYNVCSGEEHSLLEMVEKLVQLSATGARVVVDADRFRPADIPVLVGNPARLRALGWRPEIDLDRTLSDILEAAHEE